MSKFQRSTELDASGGAVEAVVVLPCDQEPFLVSIDPNGGDGEVEFSVSDPLDLSLGPQENDLFSASNVVVTSVASNRIRLSSGRWTHDQGVYQGDTILFISGPLAEPEPYLVCEVASHTGTDNVLVLDRPTPGRAHAQAVSFTVRFDNTASISTPFVGETFRVLFDSAAAAGFSGLFEENAAGDWQTNGFKEGDVVEVLNDLAFTEGSPSGFRRVKKFLTSAGVAARFSGVVTGQVVDLVPQIATTITAGQADAGTADVERVREPAPVCGEAALGANAVWHLWDAGAAVAAKTVEELPGSPTMVRFRANTGAAVKFEVGGASVGVPAEV